MSTDETGRIRSWTLTPSKPRYVPPPGAVDAMADAATRWLDDPRGLKSAGAASRERVTRLFSMQAEAKGINAVYEAVWSRAD